MCFLRGQRQRHYLDASMPQYGESNVGHLVEKFGKVDRLEDVELPVVSDILESKNAGYEMIGADGFSCIACHDYNGQEAGGAGALDIVHVTGRIQKNWFSPLHAKPPTFSLDGNYAQLLARAVSRCDRTCSMEILRSRSRRSGIISRMGRERRSRAVSLDSRTISASAMSPRSFAVEAQQDSAE